MSSGTVEKRPKPAAVARLTWLGPWSLVLLTLTLVTFIHFVALWVFARGFLLNRVALSDRSDTATLPARYNRLILLVVDALRDDFLFPLDSGAPGYVDFYHNVLTTPARLSKEQPHKALSFRFVADPPTTTLQRLKGLTVGTLPTFIDAGSNFAGSEAEEDSWLEQARRAGKRIAFVGDDTWLTIFPPATGILDVNMTFPYDSFNVEDLDTVDNGVREHLYPLLKTKNWDILIGHFLGLDHVGHRVGPYHREMTRKLKEADEVVQRVVADMKDTDLLVLMGDHGMDSKGDHGGDSALEVNAGLWLYSPAGVTARSPPKVINDLLASTTDTWFHRNGIRARSVPQISLVPTLSLVLGLPIPFSNLGSVIPEVFAHSSKTLEQAFKLNADQVATYLRAYMAGDGSADLARSAPGLLDQYEKAKTPLERATFLRATLGLSKEVWATFDAGGMMMGVFLLIGGFVATARLYRLSGEDGALWRTANFRKAVAVGLAIGAESTGLAVFFLIVRGFRYSLPRVTAGGFSGGAIMGIVMARREVPNPARPRPTLSVALELLLPLAHASIFASNSLIVWEDRILLGLLLTPLLAMTLSAFSTKSVRLKRRIFGLSAAGILCLRIATFARLCREEQQGGGCTTTFYGHDELWLVGSLICSMVLPTIIKAFMAISQAHHGFTILLLDVAMRTVLMCGTTYWYLESQASTGPLKNALAWTAYGVSTVSAFALWRMLPLTHGIGQTGDQRIAIFGFANLFGASYLLYLSLLFALVYVVTQPAGQVSLAFGFVGLLCALEANDSWKDAMAIPAASGPNLLELSFLVLWSHVMFFATGHQATLPSIQWKVAFMGTSTVRYPLSPLLVTLNTLGPLCLLPALGVPLLVFWNTAPPAPRSSEPTKPMYRRLLRACLGLSLLFTLLALPATLFAAYFRRHLMVWKIFAPRWMTASMALVAADGALLVLAVILGAHVTLQNVARFVGAQWA